MGAAKRILAELPEWAKDIPYQVKKMAVSDAYQALANGCKKYRSTGEAFKLSFRSLRNPKQSCFIPSSAISPRGVYYRKSGILTLTEAIPPDHCDSRLVCDHGRWYLRIPYRKQLVRTENQGRIVALAPGIRTFLTGYAQDMAFKIGSNDFARIVRLCVHSDKLISEMSKSVARKRKRLKKALSRLKHKIWDLVDELHFKSIKFLVDNYDVILLPTFETSPMVVKVTRRIGSKTVRAMTTFAFFRFSERLQAKAASLGKVVHRVCEAYTSKTASWTGELKSIGSAKTITSNGITLDRDINGARGIFLRALVDTPSLFTECAFVRD